MVTGQTGARKTTEIESRIKEFNSEHIAFPSRQRHWVRRDKPFQVLVGRYSDGF